MIKPNVFFLTIDSLRADKCYGSAKSAKTPNLDSLIDSGVYFSQAISSADQTGTSLASIFTSLFSLRTGITHFNFSSSTKTYFDIFKNNHYFTSGCFPDHDFFLKILSKLDDNYAYVYNKLESWRNLYGGLGQTIVEKLSTLKNQQPWIYAAHIMDLHNLSALSPEFKKEEFGETPYDQMLSSIDVWLGKFIEKIDLNNTLVVITSDHGSYIPITNTIPDEIPTVQRFMKKIKKKAPLLEPVGIKLFLLMRKIAKEYRTTNLKKNHSAYELRSLSMRGDTELYDDAIRVPLLFSGYGVNKKIINALVRHVDIFPTISDIVKLENDDMKPDGLSLVPLINNEAMPELSAFIETGVTAGQFSEKVNPKSVGKMIGIRTSRYKLLKSRNDNDHTKILYDLQNDPKELENIAEHNPDVVKQLEKQLKEIMIPLDVEKPQDLSDEEQQKAEDLLRKLGYI